MYINLGPRSAVHAIIVAGMFANMIAHLTLAAMLPDGHGPVRSDYRRRKPGARASGRTPTAGRSLAAARSPDRAKSRLPSLRAGNVDGRIARGITRPTTNRIDDSL
jgi:hypothetical protein